MSTDPTDDLIEALVVARERGVCPQEAEQLVADVYTAPWDEKPANTVPMRRAS
jgi:hypothetical protein